MIDTTAFMEKLALHGYEKVLSVPCSFLKYPINYAINHETYIPVANEGEAVAISAGMALAKKKSVVFMQNSGLSNAMSPLTSLNAIYQIPCLMVIGYRGSSPDEPQHKLMGRITEKLLEDMGICYEVLSSETSSAILQLEKAIDYIKNTRKMFCLLAKKDVFEQVTLQHRQVRKPEMIRHELLKQLAQLRDEHTAIVATTGFTSRELYQMGDDVQNFYMVGSMGCATAVGLGLAIGQPHKKIIVVDGDGAFLMRPSILPVLSAQRPANFLHILLSNETYESTGGQPLPAMRFSLNEMMQVVYCGDCHSAGTVEEFAKIVEQFIEKPVFMGLYVDVKSECLENLGRPQETTEELKERFVANFNKI